jgi:hypothetical protein
MYYLANFKKKENKSFTPLITSGVTAGAIYSNFPQNRLKSVSKKVASLERKLKESDVDSLSKKYKVTVNKSNKNALVNGQINLNPSTASKGTFFHELGHLKDKNLINKNNLNKNSLGYTLATLRNEGVANINAVKLRGIKQLPHALGSYGTYLASGASRHKRGLAGLTLGTGIVKTVLDRKKKNKNRYD